MIGEKVRKLRESHNILLRQLAAKLDMDTAMLSKMERGDRVFRKEDIEALAAIFDQSRQDLLSLWLADKIVKTVASEEYPLEALEIALKTIKDER